MTQFGRLKVVGPGTWRFRSARSQSVRGHTCRLVSRRRHVFSKFNLLADEIARSVRATDCVLDGEIVCLRADGRRDFYALLFRREWPLFYAFDAAANRAKDEEANRNLASISPFFIVKDLQVSISYYIERLGFRLDFQGPDDDPYYAGVSRDGIGIMLKAILPDVLPQPNHTRHEWARWDAYIYTLDPDVLFDEFSQRGASFVKKLSFIDEGLWGFEVTDADGYVLAFFRLRRD
jgi:catechol 2,3-dioxygenase-like lactoylglutathione lyase family enzyme